MGDSRRDFIKLGAAAAAVGALPPQEGATAAPSLGPIPKIVEIGVIRNVIQQGQA